MQKLLLRLMMIGVLGCSVQIVSGETLTFRADAWCPYNCDPKDEHPGILIEIAKFAFERAGYQIDYQLMNWARAKIEIKKGTIDGIVGMAKDEDTIQEYVFGDQEQAISNLCYFVREGYPWRFQGVPSLASETLGVINDYGYYTELDEYIKQNQNTGKVQFVAGDNPLPMNINKLLANRVSVIVDDRFVVEYLLKTMNQTGKVIDAGCSEILYEAHIAFSKANPKASEYANILSDGVLELRRTGEFQKILANYGVSDWK